MSAVHDTSIAITKLAEQQRQADKYIGDIGHRDYQLTTASQSSECPAQNNIGISQMLQNVGKQNDVKIFLIRKVEVLDIRMMQNIVIIFGFLREGTIVFYPN